MTTVPSATTWGSPTAVKHALLIHGLTSSSHTWHRVAPSLVAQGYFVTAPNLVGHGYRTSSDSDYRFGAVVNDLRPYLEGRTYSLIIGHSWGAVVSLSLLPHLSTAHRMAIILVDPPMKQPPERLDLLDAILSESCVKIKSAETYGTENPLWTRQDCIYRVFGTRLCSVDAVHGVWRQNRPWNFFHYLDALPDEWTMSVLVADPEINKLRPVELEDLRLYPHVRSVVVPNATHWIQYEFPEVIVDEALKSVAKSGVLDTALWDSHPARG